MASVWFYWVEMLGLKYSNWIWTVFCFDYIYIYIYIFKKTTFAQSVWNLHKEIPCLSLLQLSAFVCKLLPVPVYPQRCNNQTSHIAKGSSEGTGNGPYLPRPIPIKRNRKCSKPSPKYTAHSSNLQTAFPDGHSPISTKYPYPCLYIWSQQTQAL